MVTLCNSFKKVNNTKKELEELKRNLLQEEIDYKRQLYDLQLQSAAKDLEIKNLHLLSAAKEFEIKYEILQQLKVITFSTINQTYNFYYLCKHVLEILSYTISHRSINKVITVACSTRTRNLPTSNMLLQIGNRFMFFPQNTNIMQYTAGQNYIYCSLKF